MFFCTGIVSVTYPIFEYWLSKEAILPFGFVLPGLSEVEQPGYALNYCHHILQAIFTVGSMTAVQGINIVLFNGICLMIEALIFKIRELGLEIRKAEDAHKNVNMTEIVELHPEILEYKICDIFSYFY